MIAVAVVGGLAFAIVIAWLVSPSYRRLVALSAPCGISLGLWFVAPLWINSHHLTPVTWTHWLILCAFLVVTFAVGSVTLALMLCWPAMIERLGNSRPARVSDLAAVSILVWVLSAGFIGLGALIEWTGFGRTHQLGNLVRMVGPFVLTIVPVSSFLFFGWRYTKAHGSPSRNVIRRCFLGVMVAGVCALPARIDGGAREVSATALVRDSAPPAAPLFVVGIDGGSWQILRPLLEAGRLPTLHRLISTGLHGEMVAAWPPYWSGPAWAAILTGHPKDIAGVHEQVSATIPGLPTYQLPLGVDLRLNALALIEATLVLGGHLELEPFPRGLLRVAPLWERLHDAGARVAVVRFPFSYPAIGQAEHVVSFRVVSDFWNMIGVKPGARQQLVSSTKDAQRLLRWFDGATIDPALFDGVLERPGWPRPAGVLLDPSPVMAELLTTAHRTFGVTSDLLAQDPGLDALMLYVGEFDVASHALWPYRFPDHYPAGRVAANDIEALGPVFDRYVIDFDRHLGELIDRFRRPPNVLIVSDHGTEASREPTIWHGWHSRQGVIVASGPDVGHDPRFLSSDYADVAPSILDLLGFETPADLSGRSLIPASSGVHGGESGPQSRLRR